MASTQFHYDFPHDASGNSRARLDVTPAPEAGGENTAALTLTVSKLYPEESRKGMFDEYSNLANKVLNIEAHVSPEGDAITLNTADASGAMRMLFVNELQLRGMISGQDAKDCIHSILRHEEASAQQVQAADPVMEAALKSAHHQGAASGILGAGGSHTTPRGEPNPVAENAALQRPAPVRGPDVLVKG